MSDDEDLGWQFGGRHIRPKKIKTAAMAAKRGNIAQHARRAASYAEGRDRGRGFAADREDRGDASDDTEDQQQAWGGNDPYGDESQDDYDRRHGRYSSDDDVEGDDEDDEDDLPRGHSHNEIDIPPSSALYEAAVEGLTRMNEQIMRLKDLPPLYESGARYEREEYHGRPHKWLHAADVARLGRGVCEDLSAYRAAELRVWGEDTNARVLVYRSGPKTWHAVVERGDGSIEDPSRALGMGERKVETRTDEEDIQGDCHIGEDPTPEIEHPTWTAHRDGQWWRAHVRVPLKSGNALNVTSPKSDTKDEAVKKAIDAASGALDSPAAQMLLPPPAKLALNLIRSPEAQEIAKKIFSLF